MADAKMLASIQRSDTEQLQISVSEYRGKSYFNLRIFYTISAVMSRDFSLRRKAENSQMFHKFTFDSQSMCNSTNGRCCFLLFLPFHLVVSCKKALFKIILPVCVLVLWMITCYQVCNKAEGFDYFLYWILVGCPYGIRKMCMFLVPKNFGIAGSMGILALNCIVGGLIGGIIVLVRIIVIFTEIIKVIAGHFWTQCPKV